MEKQRRRRYKLKRSPSLGDCLENEKEGQEKQFCIISQDQKFQWEVTPDMRTII